MGCMTTVNVGVIGCVVMISVLYSRDRQLQADNLLASTNVYLLRGVIQLGILLASAAKDITSACMSATDVWHTYVCCTTSWSVSDQLRLISVRLVSD